MDATPGTVTPGQLGRLAGFSYLVIFFAAIYANFFILESLVQAPLETVENQNLLVRTGTLAFLITVVFDVVVAWALYELFRDHVLSGLSTFFRMMHAGIMGVAVFSLATLPDLNSAEAIQAQVNTFNTIWLIGLFFFGIHLILLGRILKAPKWISYLLMLAGVMYMADTCAHFLLEDYDNYATIFLALVAIPSILGEMSFAIWLLVSSDKKGS